jgi:hypothetical protein
MARLRHIRGPSPYTATWVYIVAALALVVVPHDIGTILLRR